MPPVPAKDRGHERVVAALSSNRDGKTEEKSLKKFTFARWRDPASREYDTGPIRQDR